MPLTKRSLAKKRDKLKASAKVAAQLAAAERSLANQQHMAASELEVLADSLGEQVVAIEAEIKLAPATEKPSY